ncbi:hypothetical protein [Streptomyces sp. NPDC049915]
MPGDATGGLNEVDTGNDWSGWAVATRFDKRACVFHGTVTLASIRLWLRP